MMTRLPIAATTLASAENPGIPPVDMSGRVAGSPRRRLAGANADGKRAWSNPVRP
ncbi:MAG: hypothetical protein ACU0CO_08025 [Shimia sp.]